MPSDLRARLLARIGRKYRVSLLPLEFGDLKLNFVRIADPNRVLDELADAEDRREKREGKRRDGDELHLPYWAELWDSSLALSEQLAEQKHKMQGKYLLDLGCGMGLTGTVAAALGAKVTFADLESDALLLARANAMQFDPSVQAIRLNWRTDRIDQKFDWIIGADIIYERKQWEFLELFWREQLAREGKVLIGEPSRPGADEFVKWMEDENWRVDLSRRNIKGCQKIIRILKMQLNDAPHS
jgi:predicted nicotinamide N-methyase